MPVPAPEPPPLALNPPEDELPDMRATGGDPDAVTNATLQLRSEYGDLWERIRRGFVLDDRRLRRAGFTTGPILLALKKLAARPELLEEPPEEEAAEL